MGLRQSIDESAAEIGTEIGEELPESREQLRAAIPEDPRALSVNGSGAESESLSVDTVVAETPLDRLL